MTDLSDIRREYLKDGLNRNDLPNDPFDLFSLWLEQARDADISDPTAMSIATVDSNGQPWQRMVLLKRFDCSGFVFFTNLESRKASHLAVNNKVSLLFPWHMLERQVAITGTVERVSNADVLKYFLSRPKGSQIATWVSNQSSKISTRQALETKFMEMKTKFAKGEVPLPKFWGGYKIAPQTIEFWQGGEHRLHDRFLYEKMSDSSSNSELSQWNISRLAP